MKEKIDTLDWTEAIIVYIDLPETILKGGIAWETDRLFCKHR